MPHGLLLFLAIAGGLFYAVLGYAYKRAGDAGCRLWPFLAAYTLVASGAMLAISLFQTSAWHDPRLWYLGILGGLDHTLILYLLMTANTLGPASIVWTITNLAILVPIAIFAIFAHEPLYLTDAALLGLFLLMIYAFAKGVKGAGEVKAMHARQFVLATSGLFLTNGLFMSLMKLKDGIFQGANSAAFGFIFFSVCAIITTSIAVARSPKGPISAREWGDGALAGSLCSLGFICIMGAMGLPAIVVFPLNQGISLLVGVALTSIIFHERINTAKIVGFMFGIALLLVSVFREPLSRLLG